MKQWSSADEALDFAIGNEEKAVKFYTDMAAKAEDPQTKRMFEENANEERGHKSKLEAVKKGKKLLGVEQKVMDLKIENYLVDVAAKEDMGFQDALILAMKREKAAFKLYTDIAAQMEDDDLRNLFLGLAQEEAKHKLRFEIEYDDEILREN